MSSESSESDNFSSTEDFELKEYSRRYGYSDSGSSADFTASGRGSMKENDSEEGSEVNDVVTTSLNTSDEKHHEFDRTRSSLSSLEDISPEGLNATRRSSADRQANGLTRRASSLEGPLVRRGPALDSLERSSTRLSSSLDPLNGPSARRVSSLNSLERLSTRRAPFQDPLEGPSTQAIWYPDSENSSLRSICVSHHSEIETNEFSDSEPPIEQIGFLLRTLVWLNSFLRRYSRQFRHSKYYLLFFGALLAIPCSAGYMSSKYLTLCDSCPKLTWLVYGLALLGLHLILCQIIAVLLKRYFSPPLTGSKLNCWMASLSLPFFLILLVEIFNVYICEPVFINPAQNEEKFCIKVFYDYAYYVNCIVPCVFLLLLLIHMPGWYDPAEEE